MDDELRVIGKKNIFAAGDVAVTPDPLPQLGTPAQQQGLHIGRGISSLIVGRPLHAFKYHDKGTMATIGRRRAIMQSGWLKVKGWFAWLAWLFIHLMYLVTFENRLLVLMQWTWNYITRNRSARLITGIDPAKH